MRARVPASAANLGPGFDTLALALSLHCEVTVEKAPRLEMTAEGEGSRLALGADNLAAKVVRQVLGHDEVAIHISSDIPVARGLGSSAAVALAAAAAAGAADPLRWAAGFDGHAENAAASLLGGLVTAATIGGVPVARSLALDPDLAFVVLVPERELETKGARAVLPEVVPFADAVHNLNRMGLLIAGLADRSALLPEAGEDLLHQPARAQLFPEATQLLSRLRRAGALVATWSGAGPSLLAICPDPASASRVAEAGEEALSEAGLEGRSVLLEADREGLVLEGQPRR